MDGQTLDQIKGLLLTRWKRPDDGSEMAGLEEDATSSAEVIDIAQLLEQIGRDSSIHEVERRELVAVERALAKMASGNFGMCEDCSEEIPSKRLMALPAARLCAGCQLIEERQNSRLRVVGAAYR